MTSPLDAGRYASAVAFRTALETRLRQAAGGDPARLNLLRTQFVIGRLLTRLELTQPGEWVAKGGSSLLARLDGRCRLSRDLDLQRGQLHAVGVTGLRTAAVADAGDWLSYRIDRTSNLRQEELVGLKVRVAATLDQRDIAVFDIDMVDDSAPVGEPARGRPYLPLTVTGMPDPEVLLYPMADQIADKVSAMGKTRQVGGVTVVSSRYRDLADLALLAVSMPVDAAPLLAALAVPSRHWARQAFGATGLRLPGPEWSQRYVDTLRAEPYVVDRWPTAEAALAAAKPLVDPALSGVAQGRWDPAVGDWVG